MRIDFHSHILPGMDDGSKDLSESIKLLESLSEQRVDKVVLTSHFYRKNEDIKTFIRRRREAYYTLCEAAVNIKNCPQMILGAEIYFYPSLAEDPDFHLLCTEGTNFVLLELPFEKFFDNFYRSFASFYTRCDQKIVLAHIERYLSFNNSIEDILKLSEYGDFLCQMNCSSIVKANFFERKKLLKYIDNGIISVLGTDTHNITTRPPQFQKAEEIIVKKLGSERFKALCIKSQMILDDEEVSRIRHSRS